MRGNGGGHFRDEGVVEMVPGMTKFLGKDQVVVHFHASFGSVAGGSGRGSFCFESWAPTNTEWVEIV